MSAAKTSAKRWGDLFVVRVLSIGAIDVTSLRTRLRGARATNRGARQLAGVLFTCLLGFASVAPAFHVPASAQEEQEDLFPWVQDMTLTNCLGATCDPRDSAAYDFSPLPEKLFVDSRRGFRELIAVTSGDDALDPTDVPRGFAVIDLDTLQQTRLVKLQGQAGTPEEHPELDGTAVMAFDTKRRRLLFGTNKDTADPVLGNGPSPCSPTVTAIACSRPKIVAVSVEDGAASVFEFALRGHRVSGMSYDPELDRIYAITYTGAGELLTGQTGQTRAVSEFTVHEIDAAKIGAQGAAPDWSRQLSMCAFPPVQEKFGAPYFAAIGYGTDADGRYLYFACQGVQPSTQATGDGLGPTLIGAPTQTTLTGVVRLNLPDAPQTKTVQDSTGGTRVEFYPFAGDLSSGFAVDDPAAKRLSIVATGVDKSRVYVFDAAHRAWVGAVPIGPGGRDPVLGLGSDPLSGRLYVLDVFDPSNTENSSPLALSAMDTAALPPTQGKRLETDELTYQNQARRAFAVDPITRRFFVLAAGSDEGGHLHVYRDVSEPYVATPPPDPDEGTHDIDEELASTVSYTGGASGYGARARLVGGFGGGAFTILSGENVATEPLWTNPLTPAAVQALRPQQKDEGLTLATISGVPSGLQVSGTDASASARGIVLDKATEDDLRGRYAAFQNPVGSSTEPPDASQCDTSSPSQDCVAFDAVAQNVPGWNESTCKDLGNEGDLRSAQEDGSRVTCTFAEKATAEATASEAMTGLPIQVAHASTSATSLRDPELGIVTTVTSISRGITMAEPGMGALYIDEVRSEAKTWANGRPKGPDDDPGADSSFKVTINGVRILDASGAPAFLCGFTGGDDEDGKCDPKQVVHEINERFAFRLQAQGPRRETANEATGSPLGAQALVVKDLYAWWSDQNLNGDTRREVAGLTLTYYNDGDEASRLVVQLAGVAAGSQYKIGPEATEQDIEPAKLVVELLDDLGEPLAGGMFEVHEDPSGGAAPPPAEETPTAESDDSAATPTAESDDSAATPTAESDDGDETPTAESDDGGGDGVQQSSADGDSVGDVDETVDNLLGGSTAVGDLIEDGVCVTGDDGIGECSFDDIEPGAYVVLQKAAPAGYAISKDPFPVTVSPGFETKVTFTNLRSIASIGITLTDDASTPLAGGEFVLYSDDGNLALNDGDKELGRCSTDPDGACGFAEVALGNYVVHQSVAPNGLMPSDDVGFALDQPGQVAALAFVNGLPPVPGTATGDSYVPPSSSSVSIRQPPPPPQPIVQRVPIRTGGGGIFGLPADVARFIARNPLEALLIGGVWALFALPAYLAARRRSLVLLKEMI